MERLDERLDYYLTLTRLLAEADFQLQADAWANPDAAYMESLEDLRRAMSAAIMAAGRVSACIQSQRTKDHAPCYVLPARTARH